MPETETLGPKRENGTTRQDPSGDTLVKNLKGMSKEKFAKLLGRMSKTHQRRKDRQRVEEKANEAMKDDFGLGN